MSRPDRGKETPASLRTATDADTAPMMAGRARVSDVDGKRYGEDQ